MTRNNEWKPSFVNETVGIYYKDKASEFACYLMEFSGYTQISKLCLNELEDHNYEMAAIWYSEIEKVLKSGNLPQRLLDACLIKAKALLKDVTGVALKEETATEEIEETEEATTEEPKTFKVGGKAVYGNQVETVVKVTKCYVWFTYCGHPDELQKRKIKKGANGNEYVEFQETGWGRGNCQWYTYKAA